MSVSSAKTQRPVPAAARWCDRPAWWLWLAILAGCFLAYRPALDGGFLWDDDGHVTRPELRSAGGLVRIWFERGATQQYYPVLHSVFWLEHKLWGDAVLGYHLLNVLLHVGAAGLFATVLYRLAVPGASVAALLFAFHPVAVESVAWISEQKNTLSTVFYLLAALSYLRFDDERRRRDYAWASGWFVLALLTKTVTATLPAALLVVSWWRRGSIDFKRDVAPLLPWFLAGTVLGLQTAQFERELIGADGADFDLGVAGRCVLAGRVVWFYLGKLLWPAELIFIYPRWSIDAGDAAQWGFLAAAAVLLGGLAWWARRRRGPLAAALFFGGTLFPVLGFFNVYPFVHSYVADHFQYLASLGVFAVLGGGAAGWVRRAPAWSGALTTGVVVGVLATLTFRQAGMYRSEVALYEATLARNPASWLAHHNLALILSNSGRVAEAVPHLEAVLKLRPDSARAENNLGLDLLTLGRVEEAVPHLERALQLHRDYPEAHRNLGLALAQSGRTGDAIRHFERAVQLQPDYADAELQWAIGLMLSNRFDEAVPHFERAIALQPGTAHFHHTYGRALLRAGRVPEAERRLEEAVRLAPAEAGMHLDLAVALRQTGRLDEAAKHYFEANRLNPSIAPTR